MKGQPAVFAFPRGAPLGLLAFKVRRGLALAVALAWYDLYSATSLHMWLTFALVLRASSFLLVDGFGLSPFVCVSLCSSLVCFCSFPTSDTGPSIVPHESCACGCKPGMGCSRRCAAHR